MKAILNILEQNKELDLNTEEGRNKLAKILHSETSPRISHTPVETEDPEFEHSLIIPFDIQIMGTGMLCKSEVQTLLDCLSNSTDHPLIEANYEVAEELRQHIQENLKEDGFNELAQKLNTSLTNIQIWARGIQPVIIE